MDGLLDRTTEDKTYMDRLPYWTNWIDERRQINRILIATYFYDHWIQSTRPLPFLVGMGL